MFNKIKSLLMKPDEFEDDRDGEYVYKKTVNPITALFTNLFNGTKVKKDRRKQTFGRIKGNIFFYITFPMIFIFGVIFWAIIVGFPSLLPYFQTNIVLNGLIISLMIFGILKTFSNSFLLFKTARFFRLMESIIRKDVIPQEDIYALRRSLEKDGFLVNSINMVETIDDIERFGHPNFNDHRARMIKSKLGARVSQGKGKVSYIAGILVMLGLLGTFLGLLATIDSVGEALGGMANIGSDGKLGTEDMGRFITSLSKPLDGMGLAFSTSLFGLTGSLLIGFFLFLAGTPQNDFIENISRWIDNRIPIHNPKHSEMVKNSEKAKEGNEAKEGDEAKEEDSQDNIDEKKLVKINPPVKDQDLKDWLSGYIYMSVKMNNVVKNLCEEISGTTTEIQKVTQDSHIIRQTQNNLVQGMASTNALLQNIEGHNQNISQVIPAIISNSQALASKVEEMKLAQANGIQVLSNMQGYLQHVPDFIRENHGISKQLQTNAGLVSDMIARSNAQSQEVAQVNNQILSILDVIKTISESNHKTDIEAVNLSKQVISLNQESLSVNKEALTFNQEFLKQDKQNIQYFAESFKNMQGALMQISGQIESANKKIKSEETLGNILSIKDFVADLNSLQKELVDSIKVLSKEMSANKYGKINETLIERIERKISDLEKKLKSFISK